MFRTLLCMLHAHGHARMLRPTMPAVCVQYAGHVCTHVPAFLMRHACHPACMTSGRPTHRSLTSRDPFPAAQPSLTTLTILYPKTDIGLGRQDRRLWEHLLRGCNSMCSSYAPGHQASKRPSETFLVCCSLTSTLLSPRHTGSPFSRAIQGGLCLPWPAGDWCFRVELHRVTPLLDSSGSPTM